MNNTCTSKKAAEILGVSPKTIQIWAKKGILESWKTVGGHRRFNEIKLKKIALRLKENKTETRDFNIRKNKEKLLGDKPKENIIIIGKEVNDKIKHIKENNIKNIENIYTGIFELTRNKYSLVIIYLDKTNSKKINQIISAILHETELTKSKVILIPADDSNNINIQKNEIEVINALA